MLIDYCSIYVLSWAVSVSAHFREQRLSHLVCWHCYPFDIKIFFDNLGYQSAQRQVQTDECWAGGGWENLPGVSAITKELFWLRKRDDTPKVTVF